MKNNSDNSRDYVDNSKARFSDAAWFDRETINSMNIVIGGVGTIGSWSALYLSRIGFSMYLYDNDTVNEVNLAGQFYNENHVNKSKVDAAFDLLSDFSMLTNIQPINRKYDEDSIITPYMISAFDNMEARKFMFESWVSALPEFKNKNVKPIFIDGRMGAELGQVFFVTEDKVKDYRKTLFLDSDVPDEPCSYKSTTHNGGLIAALITSGFVNHIANNIHKINFREVPFKINYDLFLLNFKNHYGN